MSRNPISITSQIINLAVGECFSRTLHIDPATAISELHGTLTEAKDTLLRNTKSSVVHAAKETGNEYVCEVLDVMTTKHNVYVMVIVRRTA
jgi:hypothetical protein